MKPFLPLKGAEAPLNTRSATVTFDTDPKLEAQIVEEFGLEKLASADEEFRSTASMTGGAKEIWRLNGAPAALRLSGGVRLKFLYLVTTPGGKTVLLIEAAP